MQKVNYAGYEEVDTKSKKKGEVEKIILASRPR